MEIEIKKYNTNTELKKLSQALIELNERIGFKLSARGWCYQLEGFNLIHKGQFDTVEKLINRSRKRGFLPIDFTKTDDDRDFAYVECVSSETPTEYLTSWLEHLTRIDRSYDSVSFWESQDYYLQMLVEKVDLKTLFLDTCRKYHIPIATAKGWSSINQRARMVERFKEAQNEGKEVKLLYCGDFDPYGMQISDKLTKNINDLKKATNWKAPEDLVDRFGLNHDTIVEADLTWVDNLKSGSGKDPDYDDPLIQDWISKYGERKVEANAIVPKPDLAKRLVKEAVRKYLGDNPFGEYKRIKESKQSEVKKLMEKIDLSEAIADLIDQINS